MDEIFAAGTQKKTRDAKEKYVNDEPENDIRAMLRKYNEKKSFDDDKDLTRQLVQDVKLKLLGMEQVEALTTDLGRAPTGEEIDQVAVVWHVPLQPVVHCPRRDGFVMSVRRALSAASPHRPSDAWPYYRRIAIA